MDLHWEIAMLTIRARRFIKRTCKNLDINGQKIGFDRSKVECFNCHKNGHFAKECRAPKNQENKRREYGRKTMPVENPTKNAFIAQDGIGGCDWSYQAKEEHPINYALMALTSLRSSSSLDSEVDSCSKTCVKAYATLKEQYDSLSSDYKKSQFNLVSYKAGLQSVEERLVHYKKNEVVFEERINILNLKVRLRDNALVEPTKKLEKAEKERDELKLTLEKYQNSSKSLNTLLESQTVKSKVKSVGVKNKGVYSAEETKSVRKNNFSPVIIKDWNSDDESEGNPHQKEYKKKGVIDSGCSRHMTGNKCYLTDYEEYDGRFVSFGDGKGRISGKGKIKTRTLDFDDVYFCKELKYNLFGVSQMCDKKNNVLFSDTECLVLSLNFKLLDESQVLLRVPRNDNIYSVDLNSVVPTRGLTCLFSKATTDGSNLWHMRLGHINYKTMKKLVKGNLVRGLPSKIFENNHGCVACQKGKQHKASYKAKLVNSISKPLHMLHMDLFGPINNGVAERKNRTLIEASRTMLVDFKLSTTFWAEVVNTACYVLNRSLVIKPHNKTPYELIRGRPPLIDFMKSFGFPVTILNTRDYLDKFNEKADEGFFVGYSMVSKAMRVFNKRTRIVEETLNIRFLENEANVKGNGPNWLFDIDSLTISMKYVPVVAGLQTNGIAGTKDNIVAGPKDSAIDARKKDTKVDESQVLDNGGQDNQVTKSEFEGLLQQERQTEHINSTNSFNTVSSPVNTIRPSFVNATSPLLTNAARTPTSTNAFEEHPFE
nr:ribonuclease H-like domain-containing protein [Tanacetum cinerariifolium]